MLQQLVIENIALIQQLKLEFSHGLSVITGETGAGKSILLDALGLVLGARADTGLIRAGTEQAMVSACFLLPPEHPGITWLKARDLLLTEEPQTIYIRRTLTRKGRNRVHINEHPTPLSALHSLGVLLADIHGQHEHQSLLDQRGHLAALDAFSNHQEALKAVRDAYQAWQKSQSTLHRLQRAAKENAERRAFLAFQLEELEQVNAEPGEWQELEEKNSRLAHIHQLAEIAERCQGYLTHSRKSAAPLLNRVASELEKHQDLDRELVPLAERMRSLFIEVEDAALQIRDYRLDLNTDPLEFQQVDERMGQIRQLCRKHRCEADELSSLVAKWRQELEELEEIDDRESAMERQLALDLKVYQEKGLILSELRREGAEKLTKGVEQQLFELHMPHTVFSVEFIAKEEKPRASGLEDACFLISANPGEPPKPLHQTASGGEISRLMLAMKTVLADAVTIPTLIFDEVDVGVGGRVADAIGAKMARLSKKRQVLTITHQPQVAAWGLHHLRVEKFQQEKKTFTSVITLKENKRLEELARMLAGDKVSFAARENARTFLQQAAEKIAEMAD
ncbi:DNA repair protein RecN [Magnetococcales bacterium HHB-1]